MSTELQVGEVQDDYCTSCHLLLSHHIASVVNGEIAKTTCRTCFNTHDYKQGKIPKRPAKKVETKQSLMDQVLRNMPQMPGMSPAPFPKPKRDLWATLGRINEQKDAPAGSTEGDVK
ncbi:MAG: hypothetical protein ABIR28_04795 [Vicinamibacteria bacterium]